MSSYGKSNSFGAMWQSSTTSAALIRARLADLAPHLTPYRYAFNNPVRYHDPSGLFEVARDGDCDGCPRDLGAQPKTQAEIANALKPSLNFNTNPTQRVLSQLTTENTLRPSFRSQQSATNAQSGWACPNCLDPATVRRQFWGIGGLTYPGGDNPMSMNQRDYNYSYVPNNLAEYPAIGHDRRYDNLKITGASGLFSDTRAIGADWRFVGEELSIAGNPFLNPIDRMSAGILGLGLGLFALPKTLFQLSTPFGYMQTMMWYNISNQGVDNAPTIHKH